MANEKLKPSGAIHNWLISIAIIFFTLFGFILSLICIYALPKYMVRPLTGSIFFIFSAIIIAFFLFLWWKKQIALTHTQLSTVSVESTEVIIVESVSDKILKWIIAIFVVFFVFDGLSVALICIYALPDKTSRPEVGILYFLSGIIPLGSLVFVVWRNWASRNRRP